MAFAQFQGKVYTSYHSSKSNENGTIIYSIKGDKTLMEISNNNNKSIILNQKGHLYMIGNKEAETYNKAPHKNWTNEDKSIAGTPCQYAVLKSSYGQLEVWVASQIAFDLSLYRSLFQTMGFSEKEITDKITGFPLIMRISDAAGNIVYIQQTDEVKQLTLAENLFEVPMASLPEKN